MSHPSPLAAAAQRALALRDAGDLSAARELLVEAVGAAWPTYGEDHPDVLHTAHLLSRFHREADDPLAARRVLEEVYAAGERRWDPSDPLMLAISYDLAGVAGELGNRHEARRNYARVADAGPAVLGADHPAVRAARRYLGDPDLVPAPGRRHPTAGLSEPVLGHYDTAPGQPRPAPAQAVTSPPVEAYRPPAPSACPGQRTPPAYPLVEEPASRGRSRAAVAVAVVAVGVAMAAVAGVGVLVLGRGGTPAAGPSPGPVGPTASGPPPGDLELRDGSTTITLSWTDPSGGTVPFMVAGGRAGRSLGVMATVGPGQTSYTVNGLSGRVDYCFTVLAVWSADMFATSGQVCTDRDRRPTPG